MERQTAPPAVTAHTASLTAGGRGTAAVPSSLHCTSPAISPQVRFQVTHSSSGRTERERRRTASSCSSRFSDVSSPDDDSLTLERHAPDGGWGWVVVAASFVVNMIADGIGFSFGVFFVEFLRSFGASKGTTAWLGSIFLALPLLLGPLASSLVDRFGCRRCTVAGSLLASAGFLLSYFANSMELLFVTFSILPGIGLSVCYVAAVVIVAYYFEQRRSLATGISVCGTGVGTFLFPPLVEHLLQEYGWRGALLVLSAILLNVAVCGMLMRDLDWTKRSRRERCSQCTLSADGDSERWTADSDSLPDVERLRGALAARPPAAEQLERLHSSALQLPTWLADGDLSPEVLNTIESNRSLRELVSRLYPQLLTERPAGLTTYQRLPADGGGINTSSPTGEGVPEGDELQGWHGLLDAESPAVLAGKSGGDRRLRHLLPPLSCDSAPSAAHLRSRRLRRQSTTYRGAMLNIQRYRPRAASCPDIYSTVTAAAGGDGEHYCSYLGGVCGTLRKMVDPAFFRLPGFVLFALSNFVLYMFYDVPYVYLADDAISRGASDEDASMLISVIGVSNVVGVVSSVFGFCISANYTLAPTILVSLISIDNFTSAYGLLLLAQGLANLVGPPLCGLLHDLTATYELTFLVAGAAVSVSGALLCLARLARAARASHRALKRVASSERSERRAGAASL
ncbi:uncharacterized protein LOC122394681 isoform X2 [Amphibalanus amphitrite]|uniref:uncharacterized protein LOC122394681 isoform X2 n=1 Tax=Amphibalanus amphitrite TaxID=1232801 RepID=UPI001C911A6F|nr:uncharacterized protein LOC122394681 isoform X2 [Amphibalanus amphitrite]